MLIPKCGPCKFTVNLKQIHHPMLAQFALTTCLVWLVQVNSPKGAYECHLILAIPILKLLHNSLALVYGFIFFNWFFFFLLISPCEVNMNSSRNNMINFQFSYTHKFSLIEWSLTILCLVWSWNIWFLK